MPSKTSTKPKEPAQKPTTKKHHGKLAIEEVKQLKQVPQAREELDIDHFLNLLYEERERLEEELEQVRSTDIDMETAIPEEGEGGGEEDTADMASALMDKEMDQSVDDEIDDMLEQVDHALIKIKEGTYGICDISGNAIPKSRLEALPWASLTVECQALAEGD